MDQAETDDTEASAPEAEAAEPAPVAEKEADEVTSHEVYQVLERELKAGEVSLMSWNEHFVKRTGQMGSMSLKVPRKPQRLLLLMLPISSATANRLLRRAPAKAPEKARKEEPKAEKEQKSGGAHQSIRVNVETLEHLMTMVSELVLTRNQLLEIVRRHEDSEFKVPLQRLSNVTVELQEGVMKTRMQPIGNAGRNSRVLFATLPTISRKEIDLIMIGQDTELDRQVLELIKDPLTHMVRNSADHGLESGEERVAMGKRPKALLRFLPITKVGTSSSTSKMMVAASDTEKVKAKILKNELATEAEIEKMSEQQINKFIFAAGFSTAEKVTNVSGRGVGMGRGSQQH